MIQATNRMSDHSLIVTYHDFSQSHLLASGVYLRLGTLAAALDRLGMPIRMVCTMATGGPEPLEAEQARVRAEVAQAWKVDVEPVCVRRSPASPLPRIQRWSRYLTRPAEAHVPECPEYLSALAAEISRGPKLILAHRINPALALLEAGRDLPPICFDLDDIAHRFLWRSLFATGSPRSKVLGLAAIPAVIAAERRIARAVSRTFVCSPDDATVLRRWIGPNTVEVVPNGVAIPKSVPLPGAPVLLMLGSYAYEPNADGAEFLITRIFPHIRHAIPHAELWLVGSAPECIPSFRQPPPGVQFHGFLDDIAGVYASARVVVCPIRYGSGTRVKLVEAAAWGKPVVSTHIGAEGISLSDGESALLADSPEAFAEACIRLLREDRTAMKLGAAARALAERHYDRDRIVERLAGIYAAVLASRHDSKPES